MFAYCGNNPVVRADYDGFAGELTIGWTSTMWWITLVDGLLPIGDALYALGTAACCFIDSVGVDNIAFLASEGPNAIQNLADQVSDVLSNPPPDGPQYRRFTRANFRYNFQQFTNNSGEGMQAHHVLPNKHCAQFAKAGINIQEPQFGSWVDKSHQMWSKAYNDAWKYFFLNNDNPTEAQILNFARELADQYGLTIYF